MSNSSNEPFDEVNLDNLFNAGSFSDIIIISSKTMVPYARSFNGRLVVNIGSLGMDSEFHDKRYMTLMSIYQGQGPLCDRTKI